MNPGEAVPLLPRTVEPERPAEPDLLILLRPMKDQVPTNQRLKRLIKAIGRAYRFRVLRVQDVGGEPGPLQRILENGRHGHAAGQGGPGGHRGQPGRRIDRLTHSNLKKPEIGHRPGRTKRGAK